MKKSVLAMCFLAVLIGSFLGSAWYHQWGSGKGQDPQGGPRILYYVDPMNPAHTSDKPGMAPCGMPMEPVYAESETAGGGANPRYVPPGTVRISPEKQQVIGVRVEKVEMTAQAHALRTLGRVAAEENLTYRIIASTEGWVQDVQGCTTGSLVQKDHVMARMNPYNEDFYTWQRQFLTYTAYQRPPGTPPPAARLPRARQPETIPRESLPAEANQPATHQHGSQPTEMDQPEAHQHGTGQMERMRPAAEEPEASSAVESLPEAQQPGGTSGEARQDQATQAVTRDSYTKQLSNRNYTVDINVYRARLELLNVGLREEQIEELMRTGQYQTQVEIRSPVTGFVLSRSVSPRQKSERGAELFQVADLTRVWILADVFERDVPLVRPGGAARVAIPHRGSFLEARVAEVLPQFDTVTRTFKVRLEVDNPDFALIPDMFVDVDLPISLPPAMTVPVDAVLDSGLRKTVFVDTGNGYFEPRSVITGWRYGGRTEIVEGVMPGESVVVSGNFLVDSESRMKLAAAGLHGRLVKDPTCEMEVYADKARKEGLISTVDGSTVYFCSKQCKALFDERQARKAGESAAEVPHAGPGQKDVESMEGFWKDPVCGMILPADKARALGFRSEYQGKTIYFCSEECRKQFERMQKQPAEKAAAGQGPDHAPGHGGKGHD